MSLQVQYIDAPVGMLESAEVQTSASQPFGTQQQVTSGADDIPWATLEQVGWPLNGKCRLIPDEPFMMGWWSETLSGDDGTLDPAPVISISFPQAYSAEDVGFRFWPSLQQWCSEMEVSWYLGDQLLSQSVVFPDSAEWILTVPAISFDKIEIVLLKTNLPNQFAKIQQVQIGHIVVFMQNEIVRVTLLNEIDPSLCQLSVDTMTVQIRDRKGRNLIPKQDQAIHLYRDGVRIASHYITDSQQDSRNSYTFQCQSAIGRLEDDFLGGIYENEPLNVLLKDVLGDFPFSLSDHFADKTVSGYLPVCTRREALQQIAFAVGAVVSTQGSGVIRLNPLETEVSGAFEKKSVFSGAKVKREPQTASVRLFAHSYTQTEETEYILEGEEIHGENVLFVFDEPHYDYSASGSAKLVASGANWVKITADGYVSLEAKKYRHTASVLTKENPLATAAEKGNAVTIDSATLVNAGNATGILKRLYEFHSLKRVLEQDAVINNQHAGQFVDSVTPFGNRIVGYITGMDNTFTSSGTVARVEIRGKEVDA